MLKNMSKFIIRLKRGGLKLNPIYTIVVADKKKRVNSGKIFFKIGYYFPIYKNFSYSVFNNNIDILKNYYLVKFFFLDFSLFSKWLLKNSSVSYKVAILCAKLFYHFNDNLYKNKNLLKLKIYNKISNNKHYLLKINKKFFNNYSLFFFKKLMKKTDINGNPKSFIISFFIKFFNSRLKFIRKYSKTFFFRKNLLKDYLKRFNNIKKKKIKYFKRLKYVRKKR